MPSWLVELTKLVPSLAIPGAYGAAAFGLFHWLDKKASGQAKRAISEWLKPLPYDRAAVGAAVVELFDRIYTSPLLSFRAFGRSMLLHCLSQEYLRLVSCGVITFKNGPVLRPYFMCS